MRACAACCAVDCRVRGDISDLGCLSLSLVDLVTDLVSMSGASEALCEGLVHAHGYVEIMVEIVSTIIIYIIDYTESNDLL